MGKKSSKRNPRDQESLTTPIVEVKYTDPLFSVAAHPSKPVILSGLGTGHVYCHTYDAKELESRLLSNKSEYLKAKKGKHGKDLGQTRVSGLQTRWWEYVSDHSDTTHSQGISTGWKTKRHKGSCRTVIFETLQGSVGDHIYTGGTDHIIKKAASETGKVVARADISAHLNEKDAITTLTQSISNPFLLAGTQNGSVLVYDSRNLGDKLRFDKLSQVHEDTVTQILAMPDVSAYHYLSLGSSTLTHLDIRKGIVTQSEDQGDELLSMCYPSEFVSGGKNDTVVVSHGEGVLTTWRNSINRLADPVSRIKINKNASIDALIPTMNMESAGLADCVWCGDSNGLLHRVDYKRGRVQEVRVHSNSIGGTDEVGNLDIDYDYRLVSSGLETLKIWSHGDNNSDDGSDTDDGSDSDSESDSDSDSDSDLGGDGSDSDLGGDGSDSDLGGDIGGSGSDSEDGNDGPSGGGSSEDERVKRGKSKKINLNTNTEKNQEPKKKKLKLKKLPVNKGIARFDGL